MSAQVRKTSLWVWLLAYFGVMAALLLLLNEARQRTLLALDTPQARADWQLWKAQAERATKQPGAVQRRAPTINEPPSLILMRDHFVAVAVSSLTIASFLFWFFAIVARGAAGQRGAETS